VFLEDAGFDWKVLGPDVQEADYVAWQCDQDAYACSGQKCSAQSILFAHSNWVKAGLFDKLRQLAAGRKLDDLTVGPVITWTTQAMLDHKDKLLQIPGAACMPLLALQEGSARALQRLVAPNAQLVAARCPPPACPPVAAPCCVVCEAGIPSFSPVLVPFT
jgi:hypothetical protein